MATFFLFGRYSPEALRGISAERTEKVVELIEGMGGKVEAIYALLGERDLVLIVDLPGLQEAFKASVALGKLTGISFSTSAALKVEDFDRLATSV
ncbi:MAG: hypothetical protein DRG55_02355 [Deltaproteobacteria bacterium]|nr:MAG: hypothetical protein DRG55_02355 [Deltaproteobacteria bacterium]